MNRRDDIHMPAATIIFDVDAFPRRPRKRHSVGKAASAG